jgi:tRNA-dihydrouridine synthase A
MSPPIINRRLAVAPMMEWTDRHFRRFMRLITRRTLLYTEMITTSAILRGDTNRFLQFDASEHPLAIQLGGSDPKELGECARIAAVFGYDEVNLNVGCPSDRVQSGKFGACLMAEPELVAQCILAMRAKISIPVTVKTRIGIDTNDSYDYLANFVRTVADAGCDTFIIHARKAWLEGLSPKENREIPPLNYDRVYQLKKDFPELIIVVNGGIHSLAQAQAHLDHVDGTMIGREAYHNPYILSEADNKIFGEQARRLSRHEILETYMSYVEQQLASGIKLNSITRHLLGLFQGVPGARAWRRFLSENAHKPGADTDVLFKAAKLVNPHFSPGGRTQLGSD